ncbi:hypothetical protein BDV27DRAFT_133011 [Aspergillus caelatus]|uniref:Uncharacterized protein n=1 Tax=Aspergillus caelatus TaxID=61420 RepID=A0A5N6ZYS9_9EURO|nr:uncharacterized protein BDV27DRAFT_133011 [Aspergillus caelatus]KAE8361450.1 hypothetical protein BDV27DRAFT_133011 [Aspergillus caelatus]
MIGIADGLSQMPPYYQSQAVAEDDPGPLAAAAMSHEHRILITAMSDQFKKYIESPICQGIIEQLKGDNIYLPKLSRHERKALERNCSRYKLINNHERHLMWQETNGRWSRCIVEEEIAHILTVFDEDHGHYADAITFDAMIGKVYWLKRTRGVKYWCMTIPTVRAIVYIRYGLCWTHQPAL